MVLSKRKHLGRDKSVTNKGKISNVQNIQKVAIVWLLGAVTSDVIEANKQTGLSCGSVPCGQPEQWDKNKYFVFAFNHSHHLNLYCEERDISWRTVDALLINPVAHVEHCLNPFSYNVRYIGQCFSEDFHREKESCCLASLVLHIRL